MTATEDLLEFRAANRFSTILADPPWRFQNAKGKMAPEHPEILKVRDFWDDWISKSRAERWDARMSFAK